MRFNDAFNKKKDFNPYPYSQQNKQNKNNTKNESSKFSHNVQSEK